MNLLDELYLYVDYEAHALICCREGCRCALSIAGSRVTTHLCNTHHVPAGVRKGLIKLVNSIQGLRNPDDIEPRPDRSAEHIWLQRYKGFLCARCDFCTISLQLITRHFSDPSMEGHCDHYSKMRSGGDFDTLFGYIWLQTWTNGPHRKYWVVECNRSLIRPIGKGQAQHRPRLILTEKSDLERRRSENSQTTEAVSLPTILTFAEMGLWIERTG